MIKCANHLYYFRCLSSKKPRKTLNICHLSATLSLYHFDRHFEWENYSQHVFDVGVIGACRSIFLTYIIKNSSGFVHPTKHWYA